MTPTRDGSPYLKRSIPIQERAMANIGNKIPATHSGSIAGLFKDESKAEKAIEDLRSNGFSERDRHRHGSPRRQDRQVLGQPDQQIWPAGAHRARQRLARIAA